MNRFPIGIQPYTVREALGQDYFGTLEKLAAIGYEGIELGLPPEGIAIDEQLRKLDSLGLKVIGSHASFNSFDVDFDRLFDYLHRAGGRYVAISLLFESKEDALRKAERLNEIGGQCREAGLTLLYHNHDWEFKRFDGEYVLELLMRETDPRNVQLELDTYWVAKGGEDPAAYLAKWKGRCPLLHVKDMEPGEERFFAEIGEGTLDFRTIGQAAAEAGVEWLIVEQDACRRDPFESLAISYRNLGDLELIRERAARP